MKFSCERCKTRYSIADERVRGKILKIRCKTCATVIAVREGMDDPSGVVASAVEAVPSSALIGVPSSATVQLTAVDPPPSLHEEWFVSIDGNQEGPFGLAHAQAWVAARPATEELFCWSEGFDDWLPVEKVSHFRGLRAALPPAAKPAVAEAKPARPEPPAEAKPEAKPATKAEAKPAAKVETKAEAKADKPAEAKPAGKPAAERTRTPAGGLRPLAKLGDGAAALKPLPALGARTPGSEPKLTPAAADVAAHVDAAAPAADVAAHTADATAPAADPAPVITPSAAPVAVVATTGAASVEAPPPAADPADATLIEPVAAAPADVSTTAVEAALASSPAPAAPEASKPEPKVEAKVEASKPEPKVEASKPEPKVEAKAQASKPEAKPAASKPEPTSEASKPAVSAAESKPRPASPTGDPAHSPAAAAVAAAAAPFAPAASSATPAKPARPGRTSTGAPANKPAATPPEGDGDDLSIGEVSRVLRLADLKKPRKTASGPAVTPPVTARDADLDRPMSSAALDLAPVSSSSRRPVVLYVLLAVLAIGAIVGIVFVATQGGDHDDEPVPVGLGSNPYDNLGLRVENGSDRPLPGSAVVPGSGSGSGSGPGTGAGSVRRPGSGAGSVHTPAGSGSGSGSGTGSGSSVVTPAGNTPLSPDDVVAMSQKMATGSQRCYSRALKADPFFKAPKVVATIAVLPGGQVSNVQLSTMAGTPFGDCLEAAIRRWRFRPSTEGIVSDISMIFGPG